VIPLQRVSQRTGCGSPHGDPRPLEVAEAELESDLTAEAEALARRH